VIDPARSFDRAAEEYERVRPTYPAAVLDLLPLGTDAAVLDLGAGTGKLTRLLAERYRRVVAVEPLDGMRAILEHVLPGVEAHAGTAEAIPLPDSSVDGVFAAAAFHWFANDDAVAEMGRVLRPGGVVCLIHGDQLPPSPLPPEYDAYLDKLATRTIAEGEPWPSLLERGSFVDARELTVDHEHVMTRDEVLTYAQTVSWVASKTAAERARIARDLDALLDDDGPFAFAARLHVTAAVRA
jgi:ubiquinone/menaquinone biosynthesis C-methylase UbiE